MTFAQPVARDIRLLPQRRSLLVGRVATSSSAVAADVSRPGGQSEAPAANGPSVDLPVELPNQHDGYVAGLQKGLVDAAARIDSQLKVTQDNLRQQSEQAENRRRDEFEQHLKLVDNLLETLHQAVPERLRELEVQAIGLAFEALCRVLGAQEDRAGVMSALIRQGIDQLRGQALLSVQVHPSMLDMLAEHEGGHRMMQRRPEVRWLAHDQSPLSGCVLESDRGRLDIGLETQLSRLRDLWALASPKSTHAATNDGAGQPC